MLPARPKATHMGWTRIIATEIVRFVRLKHVRANGYDLEISRRSGTYAHTSGHRLSPVFRSTRHPCSPVLAIMSTYEKSARSTCFPATGSNSDTDSSPLHEKRLYQRLPKISDGQELSGAARKESGPDLETPEARPPKTCKRDEHAVPGSFMLSPEAPGSLLTGAIVLLLPLVAAGCRGRGRPRV
jgi:hypothetical protein